MRQQHLVFGTGLIGSYLCAHLVRANYPTRALGRPSFAQHFNQSLTISDYADTSWKVALPPNTFTADITTLKQNFDVVWVTVKCTSLEAIIPDLQKVVGPNTLILMCQNGVGSHQLIEAVFPQNKVLRIMFPFNVVSAQLGEFKRSSSGTIAFEKITRTQADNPGLKESLLLAQIGQALHCATFPVTMCKDMDALLWAKIQLNLTNSVNALANLPLQAMLLDSGYRRIVADMMQEHVKVCRVAGISLPKITTVPAALVPYVLKLPTRIFTKVAKSMVAIDPQARLSMWWDLEYRRATEIDFINGSTLRLAQEHHVAVPVNTAVYQSLKQAEQDRISGKPRVQYTPEQILQKQTLQQ